MSSSMPDLWRQIEEVHQLIGAKCEDCGAVNFPPQDICTICGGAELEKHRIDRKGKMLTYSVAHRMPSGVPTPITVGVIETKDGSRITAWSTDCDPYDIEVGTPVELVFRRVGPSRGGSISYGFKFRPLAGKSGGEKGER